MTADWTPIFVLPNVPIETAIGCDVAALAPAHDRRVTALKRSHPMFRRFLNRFADNFGAKFEPCVLLLNAEAPQIFREVTALASFRDLIALAAVTHGRARELRYPRGHRVLFGEAFAIYPWMLDRHYEDVIGSTPAILGTHEVARFKGQSSPTVFRTPLSDNDVDQPLLAALMARWRRSYESPEPAWEDVALMRSLNMAYHASLLPAGTDTTFYDVGRIVSLWVSAFEILVHPGTSGQANRDKVFELIEHTQWTVPASGRLTHDTGGKSMISSTGSSISPSASSDNQGDTSSIRTASHAGNFRSPPGAGEASSICQTGTCRPDARRAEVGDCAGWHDRDRGGVPTARL